MDVLNTTGGGADVGLIFLGILGGMLTILIAYLTYDLVRGRYWFLALVALILTTITALISCAIFFTETPIRHEVTLRPGHVIDAQKYEIVEQRGKIYVIEEREVAE